MLFPPLRLSQPVFLFLNGIGHFAAHIVARVGARLRFIREIPASSSLSSFNFTLGHIYYGAVVNPCSRYGVSAALRWLIADFRHFDGREGDIGQRCLGLA